MYLISPKKSQIRRKNSISTFRIPYTLEKHTWCYLTTNVFHTLTFLIIFHPCKLKPVQRHRESETFVTGACCVCLDLKKMGKGPLLSPLCLPFCSKNASQSFPPSYCAIIKACGELFHQTVTTIYVYWFHLVNFFTCLHSVMQMVVYNFVSTKLISWPWVVYK